MRTCSRLVALAALLLAGTLALSWPARLTRPAGDDYGMPLYASLVAGRDGFGALLRPTQALRYRPGEAVVMWATQGVPVGDVYARVRGLHAVSFGAYLLGVLCFARAVGLGRVGIVVAGVVAAVHPVQIGVRGGMDNFSVHALFAVVFGGMAVLARKAGSALWVAGVGFGATLLASAFKEYGYGVVLFAPLVAWRFAPSKKWRHAAVACVAAVAAVGVHQGLRVALMPDGVEAAEPGRRSVADVGRNAALYAGGALFVGDSVAVMTGRASVVWAGGVVVAFVTVVGAGLFPASRSDAAKKNALFLAACFVPVTMPNVLLMRVSEVYLPGVVGVLACVCGVAAEGVARSGRGARVVVTAGAAALLVVACAATWAKAAALGRLGPRVDALLSALDSAVPEGARRVAVLYLVDDERGVRTYSVFELPDRLLAPKEDALRWVRAGARVRLDARLVGRVEDFDAGGYDRVIVWRPGRGEFETVAPESTQG